MDALRWDIFCRVIDNHGDVGVCWRLAADLAARGRQVRLWIDDASSLAWMAPAGVAGVTVHPWPDEAAEIDLGDLELGDDHPGDIGPGDVGPGAVDPGDVVIEAFGCELPTGFVARMAQRARPPAWINLEYLSAEAYVERNHGMRSPQASGPGAGLSKWFFYPGFNTRTGGLIREEGLPERRASFDPAAWLRGHGLERRAGERVISIFCYEQPALPALMKGLAAAAAQAGPPTLVLLTHGHAARQGAAWLDKPSTAAGLRVVALPSLSQVDYDHLLWSCDLNFVRGEDSFVRAQWAGAPFVWQIYPQDDGAHHVKLQAFLALHLAHADDAFRGRIERFWAAWNGTEADALPPLPPAGEWQSLCTAWRERLLIQNDLTTRLLDFVREKG